MRHLLFLFAILLFGRPQMLRSQSLPDDSVVLSGELKKWHRLALTIEGPASSETAPENPFLHYRLLVTFRHRQRRFTVPGFYAADGEAAESSAASGNRWRIYFTPDAAGEWSYDVSFRYGTNIAVSLDPFAGRALAPDGSTGVFTVGDIDEQATGFRREGRLAYTGERYLRLQESGRYFIKGGSGGPENLLAYHDFDGTRDNGGPQQPTLHEQLHRYQPHVRHWRTGDPAWQDGKGKGLIGGMNYLASKGVNSTYFLVMNVAGDGDDVWPWIHPDSTRRYDVSKLAQWEIVFDHLDDLGIHLNVFTQETENDTLFNGGRLGLERRLYYRELVARFGHHLGLTWNLGEENNNTTEERMAFARYIHALDPYDHPIAVHNHVHLIPETYDPLLGQPPFTGTSFQIANPADVHLRTLQYTDAARAAGRPWAVAVDEIGHFSTGVMPDGAGSNQDTVRHLALWGNLMAGGAGVEWYFGYLYPHADLNLEDWTSRDRMWEFTRYALDFFQGHLPFWEMYHHDGLTWESGDYVLAKPGEVYAIYLPQGGSPVLELKDYHHPFSVRWYDPREGGPLQTGSRPTVTGGSPTVGLGAPPHSEDKDWVVLVKRSE